MTAPTALVRYDNLIYQYLTAPIIARWTEGPVTVIRFPRFRAPEVTFSGSFARYFWETGAINYRTRNPLPYFPYARELELLDGIWPVAFPE